jgi:hypothetical protein
MNQVAEAQIGHAEGHSHEHYVAVAVITTSGIYPSDEEFQRALNSEKIEVVLAAAAKALELTDTSDWVVRSHGRNLNPAHTFHAEHLHGIVSIEWHKPEGGGGA